MLSAIEISNLRDKIADSNDQQAFGKLYMAFFHPLLQFADSIIKDRQLAEEIVSDVFIRIWQNRKSIHTIDNLKLYLYISTKNTALNYLSRHFRKETISIDEISINAAQVSYNPEQLLITSEAVKKIETAINNLPPRCRLIFRLVKNDGLKYNDIAELLNISVKTIDAQMAIAVKRISSSICFDLKKTTV